MSTGNQALRTPQFKVEQIIETVIDMTGRAVGNHAVGITVPVDKFVTRAFLSNPTNDLASGGSATVGVLVGATQVIADTAIATVKDSGVATEDTTPDYSASTRVVYIKVGTADLTAGKLVVKVAYI